MRSSKILLFRVSLLAVVVTAAASFLASQVESAVCANSSYEADVKTSDDVQTLRDALDCTGQRSFVVTWHSAIGVDERIEVSGGKTLTVWGANGDSDDEIDAGHNDGMFLVSDRSTLTLKDLILRDGEATGSGGAIAINTASNVFVADCEFIGNSAEGSGGAISIANSSLTLTGYNSFVNNTAESNGGVMTASDGSEVNIASIYAYNNSAKLRGGAFNVLESSISFTGDADIQRHEVGLTGGAEGSVFRSVTNADFWGGPLEDIRVTTISPPNNKTMNIDRPGLSEGDPDKVPVRES